MFIKSFQNLSAKDVALAGGKGASLGEMTQAGIPVPPGFVVLAAAFDDFLEKTDLTQEIEAVLNSLNHDDLHSVQTASEKIRDIIADAPFPEDIAREIKAEFKKLGAERVAVRSSATAEDSSIASWAGELESFLNTKEENLLEAVKNCWSSLFTPRAVSYRFEKNLQDQKVSVAVVIQKMVPAEISGICFTVHPVTNDRQQMVLEAGWGLGEAIVGGLITPDTYIVNKESFEILDINVSEQKTMIADGPEGTGQLPVPAEKQALQKLSEKQIITLAKLCLKIEDHYKKPQDIEWAQELGNFHITQSRPITTLESLEKLEKEEYRAVFTRPFSLLRIQLVNQGEYEGIKNLTKGQFYFNPFFVYSADRGTTAYYNFSSEKENVKNIFEFLKNEISFLKENLADVKKTCASLEEILKEEKIEDPRIIFNSLVKLQPFSSLGNLAGHLPFTPKELFNVFKSFRYDYDGLIYRAEKRLLQEAKRRLNKNLKNYAPILSFEELFEHAEVHDLEKRAKGFIYYMREITTDSLQALLDKNSFSVHTETAAREEEVLKGNGAFKGVARGTVKKIFTKKDFLKFNRGDILVSPMTIPDFVPVMKKAAAIVTDEGGITCHAAIIAREMKKPCVIGTKIATEVLHDGDLVEVDADRGIVRKIESADKTA